MPADAAIDPVMPMQFGPPWGRRRPWWSGPPAGRPRRRGSRGCCRSPGWAGGLWRPVASTLTTGTDDLFSCRCRGRPCRRPPAMPRGPATPTTSASPLRERRSVLPRIRSSVRGDPSSNPCPGRGQVNPKAAHVSAEDPLDFSLPFPAKSSPSDLRQFHNQKVRWGPGYDTPGGGTTKAFDGVGVARSLPASDCCDGARWDNSKDPARCSSALVPVVAPGAFRRPSLHTPPVPPDNAGARVVKIARTFLHTPYAWGGESRGVGGVDWLGPRGVRRCIASSASSSRTGSRPAVALGRSISARATW